MPGRAITGVASGERRRHEARISRQELSRFTSFDNIDQVGRARQNKPGKIMVSFFDPRP